MPFSSRPNPTLGLDWRRVMLLHSPSMNLSRNPLGIRNKRIFLPLGILLALLLPVLAITTWDGVQELGVVKEALATARKVRTHKQAYTAKVRAYQAFAIEVEQFLAHAREARILADDWVTYEVDIKDRMVTLNTMRTFLDNAQSSERYYFRPKMLQITSLFAEQLLPLEILKRLDEASKLAETSYINAQGERVQGNPNNPLGKQVVLTLKGTYMVKRP